MTRTKKKIIIIIIEEEEEEEDDDDVKEEEDRFVDTVCKLTGNKIQGYPEDFFPTFCHSNY